MDPRVIAVSKSAERGIEKEAQGSIELIAGYGVQGDVHAGATVQHRSRAAKFPDMPNARQVHLIHAELHDELRAMGFDIPYGAMGENITTQGIDLLSMKRGTRLHIGESVIIEVTGLRNPCTQLDGLRPGLMKATLIELPDGKLLRKTGVMGVVMVGGTVKAGDMIRKEIPPEAVIDLEPV